MIDNKQHAYYIKQRIETYLFNMLKSVFYPLLKVCRLVNGLEFHTSNTRLSSVSLDWILLGIVVLTMSFTSTKLQPVSFVQSWVIWFTLLSIFTFTSRLYFSVLDVTLSVTYFFSSKHELCLDRGLYIQALYRFVFW